MNSHSLSWSELSILSEDLIVNLYVFGINNVGTVEDGASHCRKLRDMEYNTRFQLCYQSVLGGYEIMNTMKPHPITGFPMIRIGDWVHIVKNVATQTLNVIRNISIKVDNVWYSCCGTKVLYRDIIQKAHTSTEGCMRHFASLTEKHFIKSKNDTMNVGLAVSVTTHKVCTLL